MSDQKSAVQLAIEALEKVLSYVEPVNHLHLRGGEILYASNIFDALAALRAAGDGWELIETAPTNASILVFIPNWEHYGAAIYRAIHVDMGTGKRWHGTAWAVGRDLGADAQPTHWRPLPPSPVEKAEGE